MSEHNKEIDDHTGVETTGHEWDGIKELNNPLPRWWLWIFYASIAFSVIYWVLMPAWPALPGTGGEHTKGIRGHSDRAVIAEQMAEMRADRAERGQRLVNTSLEGIENDSELLQFAQAAGESAFGDNCATCHGSGGRGAKGYPALVDDVWLWDGTLEGIEYTLLHGIRHEPDPDTRFSMMPAYGRDGILSNEEVDIMTDYVLHLSGEEVDPGIVTRGEEIWQMHCSACHGANGTGDQTQGAPNLTDAVWLYGGEESDIRSTIYNARNSHMPAWSDRLDESTIRALAVYVHGLGGGE